MKPRHARLEETRHMFGFSSVSKADPKKNSPPKCETLYQFPAPETTLKYSVLLPPQHLGAQNQLP